ncbi:MAG: Flp family type IVb pilin [Elusimicrobiota bacterium]|nr:Flp family type IVb pilin [Elusimicrobiota bacterium]
MKKFFKGRSGQGMVEYILIIVIVIVVVFAAYKLFGGAVKNQFTDMTQKVTDAAK